MVGREGRSPPSRQHPPGLHGEASLGAASLCDFEGAPMQARGLMNTEVVPTGRIALWWRRLFGVGATVIIDPLSKVLREHEPLVIAREQETPDIKARILSRLLSRRLET